VLIFVDDILMFAKDKAKIQEVKGWFESEYSMTDLGDLKQFLGMQIMRDRENKRMFVGQQRYLERILRQCQMQDCKGCKTPMDPKANLTKPEDKDITGVTEYKSLVGSIMYAMLGTRPDLGYAISTLSKYNDCPADEHHIVAKRVVRYLQRSGDYGLMFTAQGEGFPEPVCYTDSDWAGDKESRKSTGGYLFTLAGGPVSWKTKRQNVVALSSTEAEYIALSEATKEAVWIRRLLIEIESRLVHRPTLDAAEYHEKEILQQLSLEKGCPNDYKPSVKRDGLVSTRPQVILADNQGSIKLTENVYGNTRAKHIEIRFHFVRDAWQDDKITLQYEPTETMLADIMTKALPAERHWTLTRSMGLTAGILDKDTRERSEGNKGKTAVLSLRPRLG